MTVSAADSQKQRVLTGYRVLKFPDSRVAQQGGATTSSNMSDGIKDVGVVKAANPKAAIRTAVEKNGPGTYVAVPDRSWQPVTVTIETQQVVKLG